MKTTHTDERELNESLIRHAGPALVWAALLAFFAVGGALSVQAPTQMADAAPAPRLLADVSPAALAPPSASVPAERDTAVVEFEKLDPVGVGLNAAR